MDSRSIPPLVVDPSLVGETRIMHTTAVIRHGARTPWSSNENCFPKFEQSADDTEWNCKLTTIMTAPSPETVMDEDGLYNEWDAASDDSFFLFEKFYDALPYLKDGLSNELNGTCQVGQLLLRGYEQELENGGFLRDAYGYEYEKMDHDERMRLIELSFHEFSAWDPNHLRYRADGDQRTMMSGQVLLRGLFDNEVAAYFQQTGRYPTIPLHIADRERDILDANPRICPKLNGIVERAKQSKEYQAFNNSQESKEVRQFVKDNLGDMDETTILDCLMTTMCTDRPLPDAIDDYGMEDSWFQRLAEYDIQSYNLIMKYNNAEYAKLALGPLWSEMKDTWDLFLEAADDIQAGKPPKPISKDDIVPPRLALYSGHDTTLMPLLASLSPDLWNDTDWAPYASMMLIEIHEFIDGMNDAEVYRSPYAFRLIFNGQVHTEHVPGCREGLELCDFHALRTVIEPFATRSGDCSPEEAEDPESKVMSLAHTLMKTTEGIFMFLGLLLLGVIIGAGLSYVLLTGRIFGKRVLSNAVVEDAAARMGLQEEGNSSGEHIYEFEDEPVYGRNM